MYEKALRIGPVAGVFGVWAALGVACAALAVCVPPSILGLASVPWIAGLLAGVGAVSVLVAALALARLRHVETGVVGRARVAFGASAMLAGGIASLANALLLFVVTQDAGFHAFGVSGPDIGLSRALEQVRSAVETVAVSRGMWGPLVLASTVQCAAAAVQLGAGISTFFMLSPRVRRGIWIAVDVPLAFAFVFALWALPFTPREDGDVVQPAVALAIATLFGFRAFARLLPPLLDVIERGGFQLLVAARMLRARKSGFLTAIGLLSVLAVSFSSCTLTTTLSVMGGFRDDLQQKILGNNAHVVVDREYGTFEGWDRTLTAARGVPSVRGASPYVAGEVMVTSASNLGGAVLRGIDPATIGEVTDLPQNMRFGRLEYLSAPEQLLTLSPAEMSGSLRSRPPPPPLPPVDAARRADAGTPSEALPSLDEAQEADHSSFLRDLDRVLADLPAVGTVAGEGEGPAQDAFGAVADLDEFQLASPRPLRPAREVLPGIVVGQELARSLRLHVGDEVNVVSPLGDLGPAGPIPKSRPFRVAGIFYSGMYEYDMKVVYTDLETAQRFLSTGGAISGIEIRVDDWERAERTARQIAEAIARPELRVRSWQEVNRNLFGALELEKLAMFITLGIAILVASFCIVGTLVLMVQEKGREVGILKAMGAQDRDIIAVFMLQGLFIGIVGAATGLGLGWVVCFAAEHLGIVPLNPEVYYIDKLPIHTDPREFVAVGISAVVVCLLATIYPAILGSRLKPVDALRFN